MLAAVNQTVGPLTAQELRQYRRDGFLLKRGLLDPRLVEDTLVGIDRLLCARFGLQPVDRRNVTAGLQARLLELQRVDRPGLGKVYDAIRKLASFWAMVGGDDLLRCAQTLLNTDTVGVAFRGAGIRLDLPMEDQWRSQWHQEYHSQMSSLNACVAWFSLTPVTFDMGPVQIARGSHRDGLQAVRCPDPMNTGKNYTQTFLIPDAERLASQYERVQVETAPGDVVFLDFLTLHASGFNRSPTGTRVTAQVRYFDMNDEVAAARGWVGGWQEGGDFTAAHPDKVLP